MRLLTEAWGVWNGPQCLPGSVVTILITKRGIPIAQVLPPPPPAPNEQSTFGCMAGTAEEIEDILEPLPEDDWDVLK
jgi:antitoxin (DNA-binding transcriptional repressor) of toxin-antitoxin stability system